jgi:hypothetical protein
MAQGDRARHGYPMKIEGRLRDLASALLAYLGSFIGGTIVLGEEVVGALAATV